MSSPGILPIPGTRVTIVDEFRSLRPGQVQDVEGSPNFKISVVLNDERAQYAYVYLKDEGVSWCRGWNGPEVNALKVATGLL